MSDHNGDQNEDVTNPDNVVDLEQASEHQGAQENASAANDTQAMLAKLEAENSELKDRLLRAAAEMENLRKRTQREAKDARTYAIADFARDMLSATDNLERALMTMTPEKRDAADPDTKSLIEGIEMTEREMQRLMQKNGVKPILAEGEKFNPHKHQAMFEVPDASVPEGTIVNVMQSGFEIGERVLRPAMVGVAKGGPKAAKPAAEPATAQNADVSDSAAAENVEQTGHVDREV